MHNRWPLVGRRDELDALQRALTAGGAVVLAGASGVGKTRLAEECLRVAAERGLETVRLAGTQAASALPLGAYAAVLPDIAPEPDRAVMLRRLTRAIVARAAGRELALLVDDAHLLDEASAVLTHQLATAGNVFVLVTVRAGESVPEPVLALWKDGIAERIEVVPLAEHATAALLADALGGPVSPVSARMLFERCQGNLLLLRELVLAALASGALADHGGEWTLRHQVGLLHLREQPIVSARLIELVDSRLAALTEAERDTLEAIALGEPITVAQTEHLAPGIRLSTLERREFVRIDRRADQLDVSIAHPVYAEVIRASLTPHRRRELFRLLADSLEALGSSGGDDLLRLAVWRLEGGGRVNPDTMSLASRRAWILHDLTLAQRLAQQAVRDGAGFEAEVFLAQLTGLAGHAEEAEQQLAELTQRAGGDSELSTVTITRLDNLCYSLGRLDQALAVAEQAEIGLREPRARDVVTAYKAAVHQLRGQVSEMVEVSAPLLNQASGQALVWACVMAAGGYAHSGRTGDAIEATRRGRTAHLLLTEDLRHVPFAWHPSIHDAGQSLALTFAGRLTEAETTANLNYERGLREDSAEIRFTIAIPLCANLIAQGRINAAIRCAEENVVLARDHGRLMAYRLLAILLTEALAMAGYTDRAAAVLNDLEAVQMPFVHVWDTEAARARAWLAAASSDTNGAQKILAEAAIRARDSGAVVAEATVLHDAARLGNPQAGAGRLRELATVIEGPLIGTQATHATALEDRNPDGADLASEQFQALGAMLLAAEAATDAATLWRRHGNPRQANRTE
ncbi:MAG: hypothetical protein QOF84_7444, partial [Streptomyces sp.]|nr:hypothetical protein [Streptomyces sp.]